MITEVKAPDNYNFSDIFLAGSIENDNAERWQDRFVNNITEYFSDKDVGELVITNPRRDIWPGNDDKEELEKQINWELNALASSFYIAMYFDKNTTSPITLLELGLNASDRLYVCCPEEYFRYENVRITCEKYGVHFFTTEVEWRSALFKEIEDYYCV